MIKSTFSQNKECYPFVTLLNTASYLHGVLILNESLRRVNSQHPLFVIIPKGELIDERDVLKRNNIEIIDGYQLVLPEDLKEYTCKFASPQWLNTFDKLQIFELVQFPKIVFLDADLLILHNIDHLFDLPHMSAVQDIDDRPTQLRADRHLNSGVMVVEPQARTIEKIFTAVPDMVRKRTPKPAGDQDLLHAYFNNWPQRSHLHLQQGYNMFMWTVRIFASKKIDGKRFRINHKDKNSRISIVHFIGKKPWIYHGVIPVVKRLIDVRSLESLRINYYFEYLYFITKKQLK